MIERQRRAPQDCIEQIFAVLQKESPTTIGKISSEVNLAWKQVDNYIELIKYIQKQPHLIDQKLGPRTRIISVEKIE